MRKLYSRRCLNIRTLKHLALHLRTPVDEFRKVAAKAENMYSFWLEPKKNGKLRQISAPKPRLKRIQRAVHSLLQEIELPSCAHCGIKGRSNLTHARVHAGKPWVLSMDFKDFYPSISHNRVYHLFRQELNCSPEVASILTRLCTLRNQVPQGGPMSTDIANLVCRQLDTRLMALAGQYEIDYTRFNDDLTFSGKCIPESFTRVVKDIIGEGMFSLNPEKEQLRGRHQPQIVTGLSVNPKQPRVPRRIRREWGREKHVFYKYELENLDEATRLKRQQQIQGKIAYLHYVNQPHQT